MNGDKRYHAEIKLTIEGREARVNIFGDTLNEVFNDIGTVCSQFQPDWQNPARRQAMNQDNIDKQNGKPKSAPKPKTELDQYFDQEPETGEVPVCDTCGTDEFMELISFKDKKTGKPRKAWKCQQCQNWHWDNNNGRGR